MASSLSGSPLRLARLASFRQILELLVLEENLLANGKNKISATIHARQYPVL
jgi:hypothetical protein